MAHFKVEAGGTLETVTPKELTKALTEERAFWEGRAVGVKWTEQGLPVPAAQVGPSFTIGGPVTSWAWKLRVVSAELAAAGTLGVFKGGGGTTRPIATPTASAALGTLNIAVVFFPDDIVIPPGQQITLIATQNITGYYYGAVQVPAERLGEILS